MFVTRMNMFTSLLNRATLGGGSEVELRTTADHRGRKPTDAKSEAVEVIAVKDPATMT